MNNESRASGDDEDVPGYGTSTGSAGVSSAEPVLVPPEDLPAELLRAVIEAFVLREGTEYGERDYTLDEKVAHVEQQLRKGDAHIVYDPNTQSVDIRLR